MVKMCNALNITDGECEVYGIRIGNEGREMVGVSDMSHDFK